MERGSYRTADGRAQIEWELRDTDKGPEFAASGDYEGGSGQCVAQIAEAYPGDEMVQRIARVWRCYHLNGMNAGCIHQRQNWNTQEPLAIVHVSASPWRVSKDALPYFHRLVKNAARAAQRGAVYEPEGDAERSYFEHGVITIHTETKAAGRVRPAEHPRGLLGKPCEVCGYRYGTAWLHEWIPDEVLAEIRSWSTSPQPSGSLGDHKAAEFLASNGLAIRINRSDSKPAPWEPSGHHYRVTLTRKGGGRMVFDFWGSVTDAEKGEDPSRYDVLACLASDIDTPETFEDFCGEFGEDADSRRALQTFRRCDRFAKRLRNFLSASEIEELSQIR